MSGLSAWDAALPALAGLAAVAGVTKLARPGDTARALRAAGLPLGPGAVRAGAAGELAVGLAVLGGGGRWAAGTLAGTYLVFAAFVAAARVRGWPLATCGCFGEPDTPPTGLHAGVCLAAAGAAAGAAVAGRATGLAPALTAEGPLRGAVLVVLSVAAAYAAYLVMSAAPRLGAARAAMRERVPA